MDSMRQFARNDSIDEVAMVGDEATALSEALVRHARRYKEGHCYLMLDPVLRNGLDALQAVMKAYGDGAGLDVCSIRVALPRDYARKRWPLLVRLPALSTYLGSELSRRAMQMAVDDWRVDSLREGSGHRVGAWLFSRHDLPRVAGRLGRWAVHRRQDGRRTLIRFWDPAVMDQLWAISTMAQRSSFLGPVSSWAWLDRWSALATQSSSKTTSPEPPSAYTSEQWARLDHIGPINRLWVKAHAEGIALTREHIVSVEHALQRADAAGINDPDDLLHYAWRAVSVASDFDSHPTIRALLAAREPDQAFSYVVSDLDKEDWRRIAEESASLSAT
ncbi:MAG TPA: DUF4123 domain-containing protein [Candidatus Luteimonas excrementigallinarum]|nr:DUF4123 domain-containing protein [Candidatus Luteimonas excrementigallinarum]